MDKAKKFERIEPDTTDGLYRRIYKGKTSYYALFTTWQGERRPRPLGRDLRTAKVELKRLHALNVQRFDFKGEHLQRKALRRTITPLIQGVTRLAGIYLLIDGEGNVLYVGQSANAHERVSVHKAKMKHYGALMIQVPAEARVVIEGCLIRELRPPLNKGTGQPLTDAGLLRLYGVDVKQIRRACVQNCRRAQPGGLDKDFWNELQRLRQRRERQRKEAQS